MERFRLRTEVVLGENPLSVLSALADRRVLIVTDRFLVTSGLIGRVREHLKGEVEVFDRVKPDPPLSLVAEGVEVYRRFRPQAVAAFGGGSPLDCAKAMVHYALEPGEERPPFYAIPTTAGTGSEVTSFAVVTHEGVKLPLVDDALVPDVAILEPAFLSGVPGPVTADTGMDVLTHAAEAWAARGASDFTDALAGQAFAQAWRGLPRAVEGDGAARGEMLRASCLAGAAFNAAGLGLCHALAHALGGRFHLPHGRLNGILLPHVIRFNGQAGRYGELARRAGLSAAGWQGFAAAVGRLRDRLSMPASLTGAGLEREAVLAAEDAVAEAALADVCLPGNPRQAGRDDVKRLLREAL